MQGTSSAVHFQKERYSWVEVLSSQGLFFPHNLNTSLIILDFDQRQVFPRVSHLGLSSSFRSNSFYYFVIGIVVWRKWHLHGLLWRWPSWGLKSLRKSMLKYSQSIVHELFDLVQIADVVICHLHCWNQVVSFPRVSPHSLANSPTLEIVHSMLPCICHRTLAYQPYHLKDWINVWNVNGGCSFWSLPPFCIDFC